MDTKEFRKNIADEFVNSLKENPEHWQRKWSVAGMRPENCVTHTKYRGINRFYLTYELSKETVQICAGLHLSRYRRKAGV